MNRRAELYRIIFLVLLLLLFGVQVVLAHLSAGLVMGVTVEQQGDLVWIRNVSSGSPAALAAIQPRTILASINNRPIRIIEDITPAFKLAQGKASRLETLVAGKTQRHRIYTGVAVDYRDLVLNALVILIYVSIALASLRTSIIDRRVRLLAWFCMVVALDVAMSFDLGYWPQWQHPLALFRHFLAGLQFAIVLHLMSYIPSAAPWMKTRWALAAMYFGIIAVHMLLVLLNYGYLPAPDWMASLAATIFERNLHFIGWGLLVMVVLLLQWFWSVNSRQRRQVQWVLAAITPWLVLQVALFFDSGGQLQQSSWFGFADVMAHLLFPLGVFDAVFRFNLLDLSDLFPRSAFYSLVTVIILMLLMVGAVESGMMLAERYGYQPALWAVGGGMLLLGLMYGPIRVLLEYLAEGKSTYRQRHLGGDLRKLTEELSALSHMDEIKYHLASRLSSILQTRMVMLVLKEDDQQIHHHYWRGSDGELLDLDLFERYELKNLLQLGGRRQSGSQLSKLYEQGLELVIPLLHQQSNIGNLFVGRSFNGKRYSSRDMELLNLFAHNLAAQITNAELSSQVRYDNLTGLYRREMVLEQLMKCMREAGPDTPPCSVAMVDLDDFKALNDTYGHLFGDQVLKSSAAAAMAQLHRGEWLGRFGGEEFLLLMPRAGQQSILQRAEAIRAAIESCRFDEMVKVTASIGVASSSELNDLSLPENQLTRELIEIADQNLYRAKAAGKNRVFASFQRVLHKEVAQ